MDLVDDSMRRYNEMFYSGLVRPFERNSGDEMQALVSDPAVAVDIVLDAAGSEAWWVGVGIGEVVEPIPTSVRESRGPALEHARTAVERAKQKPGAHRFSIVGDDPRIEDLVTVLTLILLIVERQTASAVEAEALYKRGLKQVDAAGELGITQQSFGERLRRGAVVEKQVGRQLAIRIARTLVEP